MVVPTIQRSELPILSTFNQVTTKRVAFDVAASDKDLLIGLLDPLTEGNGFDSLRFQIFVEGGSVFDQTFLSSAAADAFFDDKLFAISGWALGLTDDLDLKFQFDLTASSASDGYFTNFVVGINSVPVPPAVWLFGSALALLGWMRRKIV